MNSEGIVFDIQRCSVFDGPGIRTTVFLKGCPLRCKWCHNPESQNFLPEIMFFEEKCTLCNKCVDVCPTKSHKIMNKMHLFNGYTCKKCFLCVDQCPNEAIIIKGQKMSVYDIIDIVMKDKEYYDTSGGGLTLSGGEPLYQFEFALEILKKAKEHNISTCVETSGYTNKENLKNILPFVDIFLYDYKVTNSKKHKYLTGNDNRLIIENLDYLYNKGCKIILRFPLIPGVNDDEEHLEAISKMKLKYPKLIDVEILPYHNIGVSKLKRLGLKSDDAEFTSVTEEIKRFWYEKTGINQK
ncbi:glycyl-radical enzyme activating protein [Caldicellulosiruptoraceae bacterium PP1]